MTKAVCKQRIAEFRRKAILEPDPYFKARFEHQARAHEGILPLLDD